MTSIAMSMALLVSCTDEENKTGELKLSAEPTSFMAGASTTFTLTEDGKDVTGSAVITETVSGTVVEDAVWSSETVGSYTFKAVYKGAESNVVTITVTEAQVPVLTAEPVEFVAGEGSTTFTVTVNGEDVTSEATITETGSDTVVTGATWTSGETGTFTFEAVYEGVQSNTVTITVGAPVMPEGAFDYTDNVSAPFVLAAEDLAASENILWADAMASCPEGWRLPTYNEGLTILAYLYAFENFNFRGASYWTSTLYKTDDSNAMVYDPMRGYGLWAPKAGITAGRCIADVNTSRKTYPYVEESADGPIIVSRDADGGIREESEQAFFEGATVQVYHEPWTATPQHLLTSTGDLIARKLQVANADASAEMIARGDAKECPAGWRVPTHKETLLMFVMGGALATSYDTDEASEFYNAPMTATPMNAMTGFTPLKADFYWSGTDVQSGRSQVALAFPFYETPMYGQGKIREDYSDVDAYLRCVRDVE